MSWSNTWWEGSRIIIYQTSGRTIVAIWSYQSLGLGCVTPAIVPFLWYTCSQTVRFLHYQTIRNSTHNFNISKQYNRNDLNIKKKTEQNCKKNAESQVFSLLKCCSINSTLLDVMTDEVRRQPELSPAELCCQAVQQLHCYFLTWLPAPRLCLTLPPLTLTLQTACWVSSEKKKIPADIFFLREGVNTLTLKSTTFTIISTRPTFPLEVIREFIPPPQKKKNFQIIWPI